MKERTSVQRGFGGRAVQAELAIAKPYGDQT